MNKVISKIFFLMTLLNSYFSFSQNEMITDSNIVLKKGFYLSFEEFRSNTPSILNATVVITKKETLFGNYPSYEIISDNENLFVGRKIWGYCDGLKVYVKRKNEDRYDTLQTIGRYCLFQTLVHSHYNDGFSSSSSYNYVQKLININSGAIFELDKSLLNEILETDIELQSQFEKEKNKKSKLFEYIVLYSNKHREQIKRKI